MEQNQAHSKSLWNYTLSPGWNQKEVKVLRQALQYYGIGKWKKIQELNCLPNKTISQIYMQTQRLLGQQSLGDFMGLKIRLHEVWQDNQNKENVTRKLGCIINQGNNPSKEQRKKNIIQNQEKYGLTFKEIAQIKKPYSYDKNIKQVMLIEEIENNSKKLTTLEIINELQNTKKEILKRIKLYEKSKSQKQSLQNSQETIEQIQENSQNSSSSEEFTKNNNIKTEKKIKTNDWDFTVKKKEKINFTFSFSTNYQKNNTCKENNDNSNKSYGESENSNSNNKENIVDLSNFIFVKKQKNHLKSNILKPSTPKNYINIEDQQNKENINIKDNLISQKNYSINNQTIPNKQFKQQNQKKNIQNENINLFKEFDSQELEEGEYVENSENSEIESLVPDTNSIEDYENSNTISSFKN